MLLIDGLEVPPDFKAGKVSKSAARLLRPIGAGERATGQLRFEVAGDATSTLTRERRGRLRIAGRIESLGLTDGRPAARGSQSTFDSTGR